MGYYEYKKTKELVENKKLAFERANCKCEICGEVAEEIHHKDNSKIDHSLENLQALCCKCHRDITYKNNKDKNKLDIEKIEILLKEKNITKTQLASEMRIAKQALERIFRRESTWRKRIIKIAEILNCDVNEILIKKENMS
ncbi:helix-turn-helix domain-containing protein [Clostridium tertium]